MKYRVRTFSEVNILCATLLKTSLKRNLFIRETKNAEAVTLIYKK